MRYAKDDEPLPFVMVRRSCHYVQWDGLERALLRCAGGCDGTNHRFERTA